MNEKLQEFARQAEWDNHHAQFDTRIEKFALLIVYDFLSELTNDDSLGEARIATIQRLAEKWGVKK